MNALADGIAVLHGFVVESSLGGCVVVCAVLCLQWVFRNRFTARWHYLLWMVLLARLALPWTPASPLSIANVLPAPLTHKMAESDGLSVAPLASLSAEQEPAMAEASSERAASIARVGVDGSQGWTAGAYVRAVWLMGGRSVCVARGLFGRRSASTSAGCGASD